MHFEFDLVQGMVDEVSSDKMGDPVMPSMKSESDEFLMNCSENSLVDELSWPVVEDDADLMLDLNRLDVFSQPSFPSPDHEMDDQPSPGAGGSLGSPETSYDLVPIAVESPFSQASSGDSDNLIGELQSVNFADLMATECPGERSDFLEALSILPEAEQLGSPSSGFNCEFSDLPTLAEQNTTSADENDNEIEQIMAAAKIKIKSQDYVRKAVPKRNEITIAVPDCPSLFSPASAAAKVKVPHGATRTVNVKANTSVCATPSLKTVAVSQIAAQRGVTRGEVARSIRVVRPAQPQTREEPDRRWEGEDHTLNKNAIQARLNRQKKKAYIHCLEQQVGDLGKENGALKAESGTLKKERDSLAQEVAYLKQVLANQSVLSGLLQNIGDVENVRLTSSFVKGQKRSATTELDHDYGRPNKKRRVTAGFHAGGGVCLHVDRDNVSLEFCSKCSQMSQGAGQQDE